MHLVAAVVAGLLCGVGTWTVTGWMIAGAERYWRRRAGRRS